MNLPINYTQTLSSHPQNKFQFSSHCQIKLMRPLRSHLLLLQSHFCCSDSPVHMVSGSVPGAWASGLETGHLDPLMDDQRSGCPAKDCSTKKNNYHTRLKQMQLFFVCLFVFLIHLMFTDVRVIK